MTPKGSDPRRIGFWLRLGLMISALIGLFYVMGYVNSGRLENSPEVQTFLNPEAEPPRAARVVIDHTPTPSPTPTKDR